VIFLCENNGYGMGTPVEDTFAGSAIFERAEGYGMHGERVDGMDPRAVEQAVSHAAERARSGEGPTLIEVITYRFRGHSMADPVEYRHKEEEERWKKRDPITRWRAYLVESGAGEEELDAIDAEVHEVVDEAVRFADESPFPGPEELLSDTYAPGRLEAAGPELRPRPRTPEDA
jgi:pyruvate dehydrogenase E1 component alpha subunit